MLLGSFLNVAAHRLPFAAASGIAPNGKSLWILAWPGSHCPHCRTPIPFYFNIPIFGWLILRGRAKCCGKPISACYPLIEAGGGIIAAAAAWRFGIGADFGLALAFLSFLLVISVIDMRRYYILDILTLPLLWLGLLANLDSRFALLQDAVLGAAGGYVAMRAIAFAGEMALRKPSMGGGDFKLAAALGAWLGWEPLPFLLFLASLLGIGYAIASHLIRKAAKVSAAKKAGRTPPATRFKSRLSFGPALSLAGALMLFWGNEIMLAYWRFILQ